MAEKIVLIDGHSILNRAFYGVPDLTNSQGLHTNAVYGFLNIMLKILEEEKPQYLMVAFDVHEPTFRHKIYAEYKGTRKPMPEELRQQVPVIQDILKAMQVPVIMQGGYEADDILGTIATRAQAEGKEVSLVSGDRDLLQLASGHILIRIPKTKRGGTEIENYHTEDVVEKYGITPRQVIDMKGLMGDTSDNIPGVPGIGEKTAGKILAAFPSLEEAYENLESVEPKRARELLRANRELAFLSKELATIKTDCEIPFSFDDAKYENLFTEEAFAWIKKLELKSLEKRFDAAIRSHVEEEEAEFVRLSSEKDVKGFVGALLKCRPSVAAVGFLGDDWSNAGAELKKKAKKKPGGQMCLAFGAEGMSFVGVEEEESGETEYPFLGISLSYQDGEKVHVACMFCSKKLSASFLLEQFLRVEGGVGRLALIDWKNAMHLTAPSMGQLSPFRAAPSQEAFPDGTWEQVETLFTKIYDVSVGAYLLNPLQDSYRMEDIARGFLQKTVPSYEDCFGKQRLSELFKEEACQAFVNGKAKEGVAVSSVNGNGNTGGIGGTLLHYLGNLSYVALLAYEGVRKGLEEKGMDKLMAEIEMPTVYYLYQMEREGVRADRDALVAMSKILEEKVAALETDIYDMVGEEFNINSPKQLGVILFEKLKLPFAKKTKTGYSTSADILEKLKKEDPIVAKILEYRQVSKLKSTYADGLPVFIEADGRIHGKFNQTITATGRISSNEPNLQNIPVRMELGREIRKVFRPKEGCVFLDADYSQIELRVLAHMSGDRHLVEAYLKNQDIHRSTASRVFHTPFDEVTDLQRRNAKAVNFGIVYGISAFGLSQDLNVPKKEAQAYIDQYFSMYPAVKQFIDGLVAKARSLGYSETLFGRRRPLPEITSSNFTQRSFGERVAMNAPIQGTAADIIKIAMIRVAGRMKKEGLKSKVVLQVHDELLVEAWEEEKAQVREILMEEMPKAVELSVPLVVEVGEGQNWEEAH